MNIDLDNYKNNVLYPERPTKPSLPVKGTSAEFAKYSRDLAVWEKETEDYKAKIDAWRQAERDMDARFKADVLEQVGLTGHPKAEKIWSMAQNRGDSRSDLADYVEEYADLVLN